MMKFKWTDVFCLSVVFVLFCSGCIIPFPHVKKTCSAIRGIVVDETTKQPIENASINIYYPDGGSRKTKTDPKGYFAFSTKYRFHWGVLFGVALNHSLPCDHYINGFSSLIINADGYEESCLYEEFVREEYARRYPELNILQPKIMYQDDAMIYPAILIPRKDNQVQEDME